jgi:small subunit ribosomal protein S5
MEKQQKTKEFQEKVIQIDRISRTVKGGRRIRFRALVVIGNEKDQVGIGVAKAQEVMIAISKAISKAKKNIITVTSYKETIPHDIKYKHGSSIVYLKPAPKGTSIIAGGSVRAVLELSGIKNVVGKILGSSNKINNVQATFEALKKLQSSQKIINQKNQIAKKRKQDENSRNSSKTQSKK